MSPELEFILGPGWKIAGLVFLAGVGWMRLEANTRVLRSVETTLFGKNGDGPKVVMNSTCLEREERMVERIEDTKKSITNVDRKVDQLTSTVEDLDGRLLVVESKRVG